MPIRRSPRSSAHLAHLLDETALWRSPSSLRSDSVDDAVPLSVYLWGHSQAFARRALRSGFVQGIKRADLKPEEFGGYLLQDSVFCYKATGNIEIAATKATEPCMKKFLDARAESYKETYEELFDTWHIQDPRGITLDDSCLAYINHEHNVASCYDPIYFVVALIPCAKLWPWLGQKIGVSDNTEFGLYTDWARLNFDPSYDGATKYETLIDNAEKMGHIDRTTALEVYTDSMKGEADFFSSVKTD